MTHPPAPPKPLTTAQRTVQRRAYWGIALTMMATGFPAGAIVCFTLGFGESIGSALDSLISVTDIRQIDSQQVITLSIGAALASLPGFIAARLVQNKVNLFYESEGSHRVLFGGAMITGLSVFWLSQFIPPFTAFSLLMLFSDNPGLYALAISGVCAGSGVVGALTGLFLLKDSHEH